MEALAPPIPSSPRPGPAETKARAVAEKFETFFLQQMLEFMTAGLKPDKNFGGGGGESLYRSLLNEHYATALAHRGGVGIANTVYREILRLQEKTS